MDDQTLVHHLVEQPATSNSDRQHRLENNARDIDRDLSWLAHLLQQRLGQYFTGGDEGATPPPSLPLNLTAPPMLGDSDYTHFLIANALSLEERLIILIALVPTVRPQLFDVLLTKNSETGRGFTEFGGHLGNQHGGFLPTIETVLFLFAGDNLSERLRVLQFFNRESRLLHNSLLQINEAPSNEPRTSSALQLNRDLIALFTSGQHYQPSFGAEFPAQRIHTSLDWDYLVLPHATLEQLQEIRAWIEYGDQLLNDWGMGDKLARGYTSLFYGPPGTGKTLSACLLGKYCGCAVYRVDLSMVVSKYIGETEKNLSRVFDEAEHRNWILFFDEADALFGKRTKVDDSRDRYANQEISFLLQRVEEFDGVVILASNFKSNIDDAFMRRFQSVVEFTLPKPNERLKLWQHALPQQIQLEEGIRLHAIADKYDVAGGTIANVVRFASLKALVRGDCLMLHEDIEEGMRREYLKEGRRI
ncbi:ATP-binding protein [Halioxenophilus sp. WMMB6]|uniref:ATP-binding protein n=1 Tax=Halioxenophilus sp. WMMB6 TaxID=3073815 RepID=UPI00295F515C|nr:ATP-binding protein [Halioxenophilus sp. WMMB6]